MHLWLIPTFYAIGSVIGGILVPRLETTFTSYRLDLSVTSAQAYLSAVASGMMALTGIVFSIAFVLVQFSAIAYSPRLVVWFARDRLLFHSLGMFVATFTFSLATLAWIDRSGSGQVPMLSSLGVAFMLVTSVVLLSQLVQRLYNLQITQVLQTIGDMGRSVIAANYRPARSQQASYEPVPGGIKRTIKHVGKPRSVTSIEIEKLVNKARKIGGVIIVDCAVGDTLLEGTNMLRIQGLAFSEVELRQCIKLGDQRTIEQDPKYALRLLVDIAIKALSPAINDPTTAVQAIDQIEDLLRRLAKCDLENCRAFDREGVLRVIYQMPTWDDYLALGFDEVRQFGQTSIQVMRRLRSALVELGEQVSADRLREVDVYLGRLDLGIERSAFDPDDRATARVQDRQGLGLSHRREQERPLAFVKPVAGGVS